MILLLIIWFALLGIVLFSSFLLTNKISLSSIKLFFHKHWKKFLSIFIVGVLTTGGLLLYEPESPPSDDTGFEYADGLVDPNHWTDATNAYADDDSAAYADDADLEQGYTFSLSHTDISDGTVDGVEVVIEGQGGALSILVSDDGGSSWSNPSDGQEYGESYEVKTYGGSTEKWGLSWACNSWVLAVQIICDGLIDRQFDVDYVKVKVYYTPEYHSPYLVDDLPCSTSSTDDADYVIISSGTITDNNTYDYNWDDLIVHRASKQPAWNFAIVNLSAITSTSNYWNTTCATNNDSASQVRRFIKDAVDNWNTAYVLLGGDWVSGYEIVPVRELNSSVDYPGRGSCITDWYFTNLTYDFYNSTQDAFDFDLDNINWTGHDVNVGRIPVHDAEDVSVVINKTIQYENNTDMNASRNVALFTGFQYTEGRQSYKYWIDDMIGDDSQDYFWDLGHDNPALIFEIFNLTTQADQYELNQTLWSNSDYDVGFQYSRADTGNIVHWNDAESSDFYDFIDDYNPTLVLYESHGSLHSVMDMDYTELETLGNTVPFFGTLHGCWSGRFGDDGNYVIPSLLFNNDTGGAFAFTANSLSCKGTSETEVYTVDMRISAKLWESLTENYNPSDLIIADNYFDGKTSAWSSCLTWANTHSNPQLYLSDWFANNFIGDPAAELSIYRDTHDLEVYMMRITDDSGSGHTYGYDEGISLEANTGYTVLIYFVNRGTSTESSRDVILKENGINENTDSISLSANTGYWWIYDYTTVNSDNVTVWLNATIEESASGENLDFNNVLNRPYVIGTNIAVTNVEINDKDDTHKYFNATVKNTGSYDEDTVVVNLSIYNETVDYTSWNNVTLDLSSGETDIASWTVDASSMEIVDIWVNATPVTNEPYTDDNYYHTTLQVWTDWDIVGVSVEEAGETQYAWDGEIIWANCTVTNGGSCSFVSADIGGYETLKLYPSGDVAENKFSANTTLEAPGNYTVSFYIPNYDTLTEYSWINHNVTGQVITNMDTSVIDYTFQFAEANASNNDVLRFGNGTWYVDGEYVTTDIEFTSNSTAGSRGESTFFTAYNNTYNFAAAGYATCDDCSFDGITFNNTCRLSKVDINDCTFNDYLRIQTNTCHLTNLSFNAVNETALYIGGDAICDNLEIQHYVNKTLSDPATNISGDWDAIIIAMELGTVYINNSNITTNRNAIFNLGATQNVYVNNTDVTGINNTWSASCERKGYQFCLYPYDFTRSFYVNNSTIYNFDRGFIKFSTAGFSSDSDTIYQLRYCDIYDNNPWGGWNNVTGFSDIDAQYCWWGSNDGPGGNGTGAGNDITYYIDWTNYASSPYNVVVISNPVPANNSYIDGDTLTQLTVDITNIYSQGDQTYDWSIECNGDSNSSEDEHIIGTQTFNVQVNSDNFTDGESYTWYLNVTDGTYIVNYTYNFALYMNATIRTGGIDYFVWVGDNSSAWNVTQQIPTMDEDTEYVAHWNHSTTWNADGYTTHLWEEYHPSNEAGLNFTVHTFDVIKTYLTDGDGNVSFTMVPNSNINYYSDRNQTLYGNSTACKGYNFNGSIKLTFTTNLSNINSTVGLTYTANWSEVVGVWNDSNENSPKWDWWFAGFDSYCYSTTVDSFDVLQFKIADTVRYFDTSDF